MNTQEFSSRTWTTKSGQVMRWEDMTDAHLRNTAEFIRRKACARLAAYWLSGIAFQGEEAQAAWASHEHDEQAFHDEAMQYAAEMEAFASREGQK